jgi:hypothetical protein
MLLKRICIVFQFLVKHLGINRYYPSAMIRDRFVIVVVVVSVVVVVVVVVQVARRDGTHCDCLKSIIYLLQDLNGKWIGVDTQQR